MPLQAPKPASNYTPPPEGTHLARCYQLVQIGTVQEEYMGKPKMMNKVQLSFELPLKTKVWKEGEPAKPISIHQTYTFSMGEKANLRKLVEGMIGTTLIDTEAYGFDVLSLVGMSCLLHVKHKTSQKGKVRGEIASASPLIEGMTCPPQFNPSNILTYSFWDQEKFDKLPDFMKEKLMESEEFKGRLTSDDKEMIKELRESSNENRVETRDNADISPDDIPF